MKKFTFLIILIISCNCLDAQREININSLESSFATSERRITFKQKLFEQVRTAFKSSLNKKSENQWIKAFENVEMTLYRSEFIFESLNSGLQYFEYSSFNFRRALLEVITSNYPNEFGDELYSILLKTKNPNIFAICTHYLSRINYKNFSNRFYTKLVINKFENWKDIPVLIFLHYGLVKGEQKSNNLPPLEDILNHPFQKNKTIIYSFFSKDRNFTGITIIKGPDGKFIQNADGSIFNIPQLSLSYSNLPGYLKNGNTPQGIFSIVGWYISPTESIGPTPNVLTRIPFEVSTEIFYHGNQNDRKWRLNDYKFLLPQSWQNYLPIMETFYAGKSGRRLIIMHGSADDISFYEEKPYYPLTPSKGCITSKEIWSPINGRCIESDQVKLLNAFYSTKELEGFLVVVEINDKKQPVTIADLLKFIKN
jgi:hypothetical protein